MPGASWLDMEVDTTNGLTPRREIDFRAETRGRSSQGTCA